MATIYFHYFEKSNQLVIDHVASSGISNSYSTGNKEKIDLSSLEPVKYIARSNTDHDNVLVIEHEDKTYTLDAMHPAIIIERPIVNATLKVHDPKVSEDVQFSISFNALCFHPHTHIKTLNGNVI